MKEKKKEVFRLRDKEICIRASNFEHDMIMQNFKESGISTFQDFAMKMLSDGYVINLDISDLHNYAYEINKIGTNINQIAHKINMIDENNPDYYLLKEDVSECLFLMNEITKIVRRHWMT